MHYLQGCSSTCNLLGALKNTTPSSGEMSLLDKSSVWTKEDKRERKFKHETSEEDNREI